MEVGGMTRGTTDYDGTPHRLLATLTDEQLCQIVVHREAAICLSWG